MKNQNQEQKDFYVIARKIKNQQEQNNNDLDTQLQHRFKQQSQQALKMINAYRKVQNIRPNTGNKRVLRNDQKQKQFNSNHPKSTYANKIKQTLRQLNANKAKQYQKLASKNVELKSQKNINSLQVHNHVGRKTKSQNEKRLVVKGTQKILGVVKIVVDKKLRESIRLIVEMSDMMTEKDYSMARRYRLFRVFSLWKEGTALLKIKNQKRKQLQEKQIGGLQMAKQFYIFSTTKKLFKHWSRIAKSQKKSRKCQQEVRKMELQTHMDNGQQQRPQRQQPSNNAQLQNKLRGFLDGLKQKIQQKQSLKNDRTMKPITQLSQQQHGSHVFEPLDPSMSQINQHQQQPAQQHVTDPNSQSQHQPIANSANRPLTNQQLQKRREEIQQRSKNRKQALQKVKKQKQENRRKDDQERRQLQKRVEEQQKRVKELKYREYHERKKLQKQWQEMQQQLNARAYEWNKIRLKKFYGFDNWKKLKQRNKSKALIVKQTIWRVMIRHAGWQLLDNLNCNLQDVLGSLYCKMGLIHQRSLKRKVITGFELQVQEVNQQRAHLQAFHQVHLQKVYLSQWRFILDQLRLQNIAEQRPLLRKSNQYHRVCLLLKSLRGLNQNSKQNKKYRNISEQKIKIKSKIKNIISQKIQINYDEFL